MKTRTPVMNLRTGTRDSKIQDGEESDVPRSPAYNQFEVVSYSIAKPFRYHYLLHQKSFLDDDQTSLLDFFSVLIDLNEIQMKL